MRQNKPEEFICRKSEVWVNKETGKVFTSLPKGIVFFDLTVLIITTPTLETTINTFSISDSFAIKSVYKYLCLSEIPNSNFVKMPEDVLKTCKRYAIIRGYANDNQEFAMSTKDYSAGFTDGYHKAIDGNFHSDDDECTPVIELSAYETLSQQLRLAIDALEFMTMPVTSTYLTVENLLETIKNDIARGNEALSQIKALESK